MDLHLFNTGDTMDKLARQVNIHHAVMQGSYFAGFSAIWGFGPVLLLHWGLSNSALGVVTSLALLLPSAALCGLPFFRTVGLFQSCMNVRLLCCVILFDNSITAFAAFRK